MEDRTVLPLGTHVLRRKAKVVKRETISTSKAEDTCRELLRVLRGPQLPGRPERGGAIALPQIGTPSRLIIYEDPPGAVSGLSEEERREQGREKPFGPKVVFNPRIKPVADSGTSFQWERSQTVPGYRALVERHDSVRITGVNPDGGKVDYVASGWEARLAQQAVDVLDGVFFPERCVLRSLRHLDARGDPLPPGCPGARELTEAEIAAASGGKAFLAGVPGIGRQNVLLLGSLILRLRAREVAPEDAGAVVRELRDVFAKENHPFGLAAPQLGHRVRALVVGEKEEVVSKLTARQRTTEEHRAFGPLVLLNPVIRRHPGSPDVYFFERSPSVPGYEAVVGRMQEIDVEALSETGEPVKLTLRGWRARMLQHAADILDGVLYVDRMDARSFRRDKVEDELPSGVPFGVRPVAKAKPKRAPRRTAAKSAPRGRARAQR